MKEYLSNFLKAFYLYLSIIGLVSFSLFIMEEAIQSIQFANFSCGDTRRYDLMRSNIEQIAEINSHMRTLNKILRLIQPIQWWAYRDYSDNIDLYVQSMQAEILANQPEVYVDTYVDIWFYWKTIESQPNGSFLLKHRDIIVPIDKIPQEKPTRVSGFLMREKNKYIIL